MAELAENARTARPLVSVGIVNWNGRDLLARCLRSVFSQTHSPIDVIVVDNASDDGSCERAAAEFPQARIIRNAENVGFARAQNQAIRASRGDFYMPLNFDVRLDPRFVEEMVGALEGRPEFGYASGLVYFAEDNPALQHVIYSSGHLFVRSGHTHNRMAGFQRRPDQLEEGEVGGASGVCPLYKRRMIDDIAVDGEFFDGDYFLYVEDVDVDWRAHLAGWRCWFAPRAVAHHVMEATGGADRPRIRAQVVANRYLMMLKNARCWFFRRNFPFLLKYELTWSIPILLRRPTSLLWFARDMARGVPRALRKRALVRAKQRWSDEQIREWMDRNLADLRRCRELAAREGSIERRRGRLLAPSRE